VYMNVTQYRRGCGGLPRFKKRPLTITDRQLNGKLSPHRMSDFRISWYTEYPQLSTSTTVGPHLADCNIVDNTPGADPEILGFTTRNHVILVANKYLPYNKTGNAHTLFVHY